MRPIETSDLYAAARGCRMLDMNERELGELVEAHGEAGKPFASAVIAEAARQLLAEGLDEPGPFRLAVRASAARR